MLESEAGMLMIAAKSLAICSALIFCFVGIGLLVSAYAQTGERALVWALGIFVFVSALHDVMLISVLLRTALPPQLVFALAALNPSEAARVGILASADPELSALGPVGFWLANTLGPAKAVALAIVWPLVVGGFAACVALRRTRRADLVALRARLRPFVHPYGSPSFVWRAAIIRSQRNDCPFSCASRPRALAR